MIIQSKGWKIKVKICQRLPILFHAQNQLTHPVEEWKRFRFVCDRTDKKNPSGWCYFFFSNFQLTALKKKQKKKNTHNLFFYQNLLPRPVCDTKDSSALAHTGDDERPRAATVLFITNITQTTGNSVRLFLVTDEYKILVFNSVVSSIYRRLSQDHCDL